MLCHPCQAPFSSSQIKEGIVFYHPFHGITSMKIHINNEHAFTLFHYKKKVRVVSEFFWASSIEREK
jgi:hypothetical protein